MKVLKVNSLPKCNLCGNDAVYDAPIPTLFGKWAYLCEHCFKANGCVERGNIGSKFEIDTRTKSDLTFDKDREQEYIDGLSIEDLEEMFLDGVVTTADGCVVEPDGKCPHGYSSPLLLEGLV